jgi:hypothetical protein
VTTDRLLQTHVPAELADWVGAQAKREGLPVAIWLRRLLLREQGETTSQARAQDIVDVIDRLIHEHVRQGGTAPPDPGYDQPATQRRRLNTLRGHLRAAILQAIWKH